MLQWIYHSWAGCTAIHKLKAGHILDDFPYEPSLAWCNREVEHLPPRSTDYSKICVYTYIIIYIYTIKVYLFIYLYIYIYSFFPYTYIRTGFISAAVKTWYTGYGHPSPAMAIQLEWVYKWIDNYLSIWVYNPTFGYGTYGSGVRSLHSTGPIWANHPCHVRIQGSK